MTAAPRESAVTEALRSLEVRWIFPGALEAAAARWFGRYPARTEFREDTYLLDPQLRGLSVKVRGGGALEVKVYRGSPGILEVTGRARGQDWWTLGFEATGPADLLRTVLQATAALVFARALPGGVEPGPDESRSYAEWLGQQPGPKSDAGA
jgi:hypothetical protein